MMNSEDRGGELLVVFLKYPEPGRVKTRLASGIGGDAAAAVYRDLVAITLEAVGKWVQGGRKSREGAVPRRVWLYFDPAESAAAVRSWLAPVVGRWEDPPRWVAQPDGDLGKRLQWAMNQGFEQGFSAVCAIGTDCPEVTAKGLAAAFAGLEKQAGVVGPTRDGGYYLIGVKTIYPALFDNIPWSSSQTLEATRHAARTAGISLHELPTLMDIDTEADWRWWREGRGI